MVLWFWSSKIQGYLDHQLCKDTVNVKLHTLLANYELQGTNISRILLQLQLAVLVLPGNLKVVCIQLVFCLNNVHNKVPLYSSDL